MKKNVSLTLLLFILMMPSAYTACCGKYLDKTITTYGHLSCAQAKKIYQGFMKGHIPNGWTCGQSVGGCGKGKMGFYFK